MAEFYMSVEGDDAFQGTIDSPFATVKRAQDVSRVIDGVVLVHIRAGTYALSEPISLIEVDSGRNGYRIIYQAFRWGTADREEVVISGGRRITNWKVHNDVWTANVGAMDFRQLYVNGRKVEPASISELPGQATRMPAGHTTDSTAPLDWC
jgi:hypothetical protein